MKKKLVIVESPAKAKTISQYLGNRFVVMASVGHIRDLPKSKLGVDVDNGFKPQYVIPSDKRKIVKELKKAASEASALYLATDPDREGEAISWHLIQAIGESSIPVHRVVFEEITKEAVNKAFDHSRDIDMLMVDAQQARRILDRLVGYKLSPILWKKVRKGLSAGRVQSVVLKMIVDREKQIDSFSPVEYWSIEAELSKGNSKNKKTFRATLIGIYGVHKKKIEVHNKEEAEGIAADLKTAIYSVADIKTKEVRRQPSPPFITSTLQQEAWRKLKFASKRTMAIAQQLYEGLTIGREGAVGLITYMRTDSTRVAISAVNEARTYINKKYGPAFIPKTPRSFFKKVKGAQEAHEAIRPTSVKREPTKLKQYLTKDQFKLYELIWKRMVSSQMSIALMKNISIDIKAKSGNSKKDYLLRTSNTEIKFHGFLILYSESKDDTDKDETNKLSLPELSKGQSLNLIDLFPEKHFTQPPPRYTEATIIKALEENGIGRPSTYAPILSVVQSRNYVTKKSGSFYPQEIGILVSDLLTEHFPDIIELGFTAQIESGLDEISRGRKQLVAIIKEFYDPLERDIEKANTAIKRIKIADKPTDEKCQLCGSQLVVKHGRYGEFISCSAFPKCKYTRSILEKVGKKCPQCGGEVVKRRSKKGRIFYGCANYPECNFASNRIPK